MFFIVIRPLADEPLFSHPVPATSRHAALCGFVLLHLLDFHRGRRQSKENGIQSHPEMK